MCILYIIMLPTPYYSNGSLPALWCWLCGLFSLKLPKIHSTFTLHLNSTSYEKKKCTIYSTINFKNLNLKQPILHWTSHVYYTFYFFDYCNSIMILDKMKHIHLFVFDTNLCLENLRDIFIYKRCLQSFLSIHFNILYCTWNHPYVYYMLISIKSIKKYIYIWIWFKEKLVIK